MTELLRLEGCGAIRGAGSSPILTDVSLSIEVGSRISISGASGCGKTSLALLIAGLLKPSSGRRIVAPALQRRREPIRMIFQDPYASMNPRWRVRDWLEDNAPVSAESAEVRDLCRRLEVPANLLGSYPLKLSGGECQRVNLVVALLGNPLLLILDEALSMVGNQSRGLICAIVENYRQSFGMAVVSIEHDPNLIAGQLQIEPR